MPNDDVVAADLAQLRALGELDLMNLARDYVKLNHLVANVLATDTNVFAPIPQAGGNDRVHGPWCEIRDQLANFLGNSVLSFESASRAILHIAELYEHTDSGNAHNIQDSWHEVLASERRHHERPVTHPLPDPIIN